MGSRTVRIDDLRIVCDRIFAFIRDDLQVESVELQQDFYWTLPHDMRYDMSKSPTAEHVGSLADDYEFVAAAVEDAKQALPILFEHIGPLLEALAGSVSSHK